MTTPALQWALKGGTPGGSPLKEPYSANAPLRVNALRITRGPRILLICMNLLFQIMARGHPAEALGCIADLRILSWWTETDMRTDSLHQSDAPLGLTWCS